MIYVKLTKDKFCHAGHRRPTVRCSEETERSLFDIRWSGTGFTLVSTKEEVRKNPDINNCQLVNRIKRLTLCYFGHIKRHNSLVSFRENNPGRHSGRK